MVYDNSNEYANVVVATTITTATTSTSTTSTSKTRVLDMLNYSKGASNKNNLASSATTATTSSSTSTSSTSESFYCGNSCVLWKKNNGRLDRFPSNSLQWPSPLRNQIHVLKVSVVLHNLLYAVFPKDDQYVEDDLCMMTTLPVLRMLSKQNCVVFFGLIWWILVLRSKDCCEKCQGSWKLPHKLSVFCPGFEKYSRHFLWCLYLFPVSLLHIRTSYKHNYMRSKKTLRLSQNRTEIGYLWNRIGHFAHVHTHTVYKSICIYKYKSCINHRYNISNYNNIDKYGTLLSEYRWIRSIII